MAKEVDTRVVQMKFDNKQFQKNINETLSSLNELDKSLKFEDASKGFDKIAQASRNVSFGVLGDAVDTVKFKFNALEIAAITAITNITNKAINAGEKLVKSLSVDNIASGWQKFEAITNATAVMKNQGYAMQEIEDTLDRMSFFADETSYSLSDMVDYISKFTAKGTALDRATHSVQGMALWGALSGVNSQNVSRAIFQLSQVSNYVKQIDYSSIRTLNMDTREFRLQAIAAAKAAKTLEEQSNGTFKTLSGHVYSLNELFTDGLKDGWFTYDALMDATAGYAAAVDRIYEAVENGEYDTASDAIRELGGEVDEFALKALRAGQEARTWTDVINSIKDAVSTGWQKTFTQIIGNYDEAKQLFTALANILYGVFAEGGNKRNAILGQWKEDGGREALLDSFLAILLSIKTVSEAIREVWREIFLGGMTEEEEIVEKGKKLLSLTERFRDAMYKVVAFVNYNLPNIKSFFGGIFSVINSVKNAITGIIKAIFPQTNAFSSLSQIIMGLLGVVGKLLNKFAEWIQQAEIVKTVTTAIGKVLAFIGEVILYTVAILSLLGSKIKDVVYRIKQAEPLRKVLDLLATAFYICATGVAYAIDSIKTFIKVVSTPELAKESDNPIVKALYYIYTGFIKIGQGVAVAIAGIRSFLQSVKGLSFVDKFEALLDKIKEVKDNVLGNLFGTVETGATTLHDKFILLGDSIQAVLSKFTVGKVVALAFAIGMLGVAGALAKLLTNASNLFGNVTAFFKTLKNVIMKTYAKSVGILNIAEAFGILAASLYVLSRIEKEGLLQGVINKVLLLLGVLSAYYVGIKLLTGLFKKFKLTDMIGPTTNDFGKVMLSLAAAIASVSLALLVLQNVTFSKELIANLGTVIVAVGILGGIAMLMAKFTTGTIAKSVASCVAILALALSLSTIVRAIGSLTKLDTGDLKSLGESLAPLLIAIGALAMGLGQIKLTTVLAIYILLRVINQIIPELKKVEEWILSSNWAAVIQKLASIAAIQVIISEIRNILLYLGTFGKNIGKAAKGISLLMFSMAALLGFVMWLSSKKITLDPGVLIALGVIGLIVIGIEAIAQFIPEKTKIIRFAVGMTLLTGAMGIMLLLAKAAQKLDILSWEALTPLAVVGAMIAVIEWLSQYTANAKVLPLIAVMGGIISLMGMLIVLTLIPFDDIIGAASAMGVVMLSLAAVLLAVGKVVNASDKFFTKLGNVLLIAGTIWSISYFIQALGMAMKEILSTDADWPRMATAAGSIAGVLLMLGVVASAIMGLASKVKGAASVGAVASTALVILSFWPVIYQLGEVLPKLAEVSNGVIRGAAALAIVIAAIGGISAVLIGVSSIEGVKGFSTLVGFAIVLLSACPLLVSIGEALTKIAAIPEDTMAKARNAILAIVGVISGAILLLGLLNIFSGGSAGAIALLVLAAGLTAVGIAMYAYAGAFEKFADSLIKIQNATVNDPLGTAVSQIKNAIVGLEAEKESIRQGFYDLGVQIVTGFKQGIDNSLVTLESTSQTLAKVPSDIVEQYNGIASPATRFIAIGGYMIAGMAEGIFGGLGMLFNAGASASNAVSEPIIEGAITTSALTTEVTAQTAENVVNIVDEEVPKVAEIAQETEKALISDQETADAALEAETHNTTEKQKSFWGNMWNSITTKAQQALNTIFGWISGSNDYAKEINAELQKGLDEGWTEWTTDKVWSTVKGLGSKFTEATGIDLTNISGNLKDYIGQAKDLVASYKEELGFGDILDTSALDEYTSGLDGLAESYGNVAGSAEKTKSVLESLEDTISNQMDLFSEFNFETSISAEDMLRNMSSQLLGVQGWADNMAKLAMRGLDKGLLEQLGALGPQGYAKVAAFAQMTDAQLQEANNMYRMSLKLPTYTADEVASSYQYAGEMAVKGYSNALDKFKGLMKGTEIGETTITDIATALDSYTKTLLVPTAETTSKKTRAAVNSQINEEEGAKISNGMVRGLINGFNAGTAGLTKAASLAALSINKKYKKEQDMNSPSKVWFEFGENLIQGLANGITASRTKAEESVEIVADAVNSAIMMMESDPNFTPVMTPVLNLSEIQNGVGLMDSMIAQRQVGIAAQRYEDNLKAARDTQVQTNYYKSVNDAINKGVAQVVDAIMASDQPVNVNVSLQGDSAGLFKMVRNETSKFTRINGYNPLT